MTEIVSQQARKHFEGVPFSPISLFNSCYLSLGTIRGCVTILTVIVVHSTPFDCVLNHSTFLCFRSDIVLCKYQLSLQQSATFATLPGGQNFHYFSMSFLTPIQNKSRINVFEAIIKMNTNVQYSVRKMSLLKGQQIFSRRKGLINKGQIHQ